MDDAYVGVIGKRSSFGVQMTARIKGQRRLCVSFGELCEWTSLAHWTEHASQAAKCRTLG
jgi:hypothetical protein